MDNKAGKIIIGLSLISLMSSVFPADAQLRSKGGYSSGAYSELGAEETYLERMSDWFATVGKSKEEEAIIKSRRRTARKMNKIQRTIAQKKKEIAKKKKKAMREFKQREHD